jgi:hypothetical protein
MAKENNFKKLELLIEKVARAVTGECADIAESIGALDEKMEKKFAVVHQDFEDVRAEIRNKVGGLHQRLDEELDKRKLIDVRVTNLEQVTRR